MKNLKGFALIPIILLLGIPSFAQMFKYSDLNGEEKPKGKLTQYMAKDGSIYSEGDTITIGTPSGGNGQFVYIQVMDFMANLTYLDQKGANTKSIIKSIGISGNKKAGFKAFFETKGYASGLKYYFNLEDCIASGEIKSFGMTSDEALTELKKWKDKFDLNLITEDEYNKKKAELSKWIK
jgi:hypothetical protein